MNPDAYGVNTEYQNRSLDASLFAEIQQDERFCGAIGTCPVSSPASGSRCSVNFGKANSQGTPHSFKTRSKI